MSHEATAASTELEISQPGKNIKFLLVDHSPENEVNIHRQIAESEAEVVLIELVGSSPTLRDDVEARINAGILAETLEDRVRAVEGLTQGLRDLVWALAGSQKHFSFIDVSNDSPEYELVLKARAAKRLDSPQYDQYLADSIRARNDVLTSQLITANELYADKKILVVMGAMHGDVAKQFDGSEVAYSDSSVAEKAGRRMAILAIASDSN